MTRLYNVEHDLHFVQDQAVHANSHDNCYGGLVIDYVPGPEQGQKDELMRKKQMYRYNQIPSVLLGPKDLSEQNWEQLLYDRIEQVYRREFNPMQYVDVSVEK